MCVFWEFKKIKYKLHLIRMTEEILEGMGGRKRNREMKQNTKKIFKCDERIRERWIGGRRIIKETNIKGNYIHRLIIGGIRVKEK